MENVVAYTRVSTEGQVGEDKFGLDVQKKTIEEYCRKNDLTIIKWFTDEGESGAKERPGFDEIIFGEVFNPPVSKVIVAKSDRVARDINVYYYYKMMLMKKDIQLVSIAEDFGQFGVFSSMLEAFTLCVAEMERQNITKRTSSGRKLKAAKGGYSGGRAPYGYHVKNGKLEIAPEEAEVVRTIFKERKKGKTLRDIVAVLKEMGIKNRKGKDFYFSSVRTILDNEPTYRGMYKYGDLPWVKGEQEPILEPDEQALTKS